MASSRKLMLNGAFVIRSLQFDAFTDLRSAFGLFVCLFYMSGFAKTAFLRIKDISGEVSAGRQVVCPLNVKEGQHHLESGNTMETGVVGSLCRFQKHNEIIFKSQPRQPIGTTPTPPRTLDASQLPNLTRLRYMVSSASFQHINFLHLTLFVPKKEAKTAA